MKKWIITYVIVVGCHNVALCESAETIMQPEVEIVREMIACVNGQYYNQVEPSQSSVERQKRWDPLTTECPLSSSKAVQLVLKKMRETFEVQKDMSLSSIVLSNVEGRKDIWVYTIVFGTVGDSSDSTEGGTRIPNFAVVRVYLDGNVGDLKKGKTLHLNSK